jgi:two-component system sensor histidine kinase and response regulator WspE
MNTENLQDFSLHDLFRMEVEGQRPLLTDGLLVLERNPTSAGELESCMRAAHSLKGAARIIGLTAAVAVAHAMEDCLVDAQNGRITLSNAVIDVLLGGVDLLSRIAETPAADAAEWMQDDAPESARFRAALAAALVTSLAPQPDVTTSTAADATTHDSAEAEERVLRIGANSLNRLLGLAGESLVESRWLEPFIRSLGKVKKLQRRSSLALDRLTEHVPALSSDQQAAELLGQARTAMAEGQQLFNDRVAQLDMFERRISGVAHRLYQEALASHMRPFGDGTRGAKRMVRDLARELGKDVRLEVLGVKTPVDRDVLAKLEAPLGHLLRNAVDHGIEPPIQRIAAGKPAEGTIRVEAHHVSGLLEVNIEDDGHGIDLEQIRQVVVSRGLAEEQTAQRFTEAELLEFLFLPGFTGRNVVTEISGRGVGLDAVQNMVKQLRGSVRISTKRGHSTRFQLHLPLTTSVLRALIVEIGGESYAFPLAHIVCTASVPRDDVRWLEGRQHFELNGRQVGLVSAQQVLEGADAKTAPDQLHVVVVSDHNRTHEYALAIDRFCGVSELVVQPLDARLGKVKDISAGALLDDGTPLLIVDVEDMLRSVERLVSAGRLAHVRCDEGKEVATRKRVLVVDDSLTVRELERKLIESGGYAVDVAVDGMDGWNAVRLGQFDLVVTDIDMPRMNGIELVSLIKGDPRLRALPVMIVSYKDREEDRRRGLDAGADFYLTKGGFHEEALLQAVIDLIGEAPA